MAECFGINFMLNGELQPAEVFDNSLVYEGDSIYEVLRSVKGCPLFFNDHMERLAESVKLKNKAALADVTALRRAIITLTRSDKKKVANIKIVFNYNNGLSNVLVYFIEPIYPTDEQYKKGVKGLLFSGERKDPESKVIDHKLRSSIYHKLIRESAYEALLVTENGLITEGSRSNIFFLKGDSLITAPDNMILNGITRKQILKICSDQKIEVKLKCVSVEEMKEYDSVFMTGTSPMVLPFYCIDENYFNVSHPLIEKLRKLYIINAEESLREFRDE
jgi:branched-chain amino acid aminotransferase